IDAQTLSVNWQNMFQLTQTQQLTGGISWQHMDADYKPDYKQTNDNFAVFASWQGHFGEHTFDAGLRHNAHDQFGGETTGSFAWMYDFNPHWRINANYTTAFAAPTFNDLYSPNYGNPDLVPEESSGVEAGLRWQSDA